MIEYDFDRYLQNIKYYRLMMFNVTISLEWYRTFLRIPSNETLIMRDK